MSDAILVLNAGSSSSKFSVFTTQMGELDLVFRGQVEGLFTNPHFIAKDAEDHILCDETWGQGTRLGHAGAIERFHQFLLERRGEITLAGVGHRVTHGGVKYSEPVRVNAQVLADLEALVPLAPLHQPHNIAPMHLILERMPDIPQVACFDTGFHHASPVLSQMFALPKSLRDAGLRRYGFHGLSYEYISSILPERAPEAAAGKTIVLHLGNGSSMCAMSGGQSIATTMGFSTLDGLPMGTRCGTIDPGVILFLLEEHKMSVQQIEKLLYNESGLLGVSGISSDVRTLLAIREPEAKLALDLYVYWIGRELGSMAAALGGPEAIVFTAGVGENAVSIRERVCLQAKWLGIELDPAANARGGPCITTSGSGVAAWVLPTNEELVIARHAMRLLGHEAEKNELAHA